MKEKILELLKKLGVDLGDKQKEVEEKLSELETNEPESHRIKIPENASPEIKSALEVLTKQNEALQGQVKNLTDTLSKEQSQREASIKAEQDRIAKENEKKVSDAVKKLLDDKKITEAEKSTWTELYKADFENADKVAGNLKSIEAKSNEIKNDQKSTNPVSNQNSVLGALQSQQSFAKVSNPVVYNSPANN